MSYDGKIMRRALQRYEEDKQRREQMYQQRRDQLYRRIPRLGEIETELSGTMSDIIASALSRGTDPMPAIRVIRDSNLDLQQERRDLLVAYGYEPDYLDEEPHCSLCRDSGYRGSVGLEYFPVYDAAEGLKTLQKELQAL